MLLEGGETPRIVLLDFGLARDLGGADATLTMSLEVLGTPAYMAPEQASPRGRETDARTDVHGLAATLFECLTLHLPREAASRDDLLRRISNDSPTPASRYDPRLPRDIVAALEVALDPEPDRRYMSAAALADDLQRILDGEPILARPPGRAARIARWVGRNRVASLLIATLAVGLSTTSWLAMWLRTEVRGQRIARLESEAEARLVRRRPLEALTALNDVQRIEPESARALGLWMELLGSPRETLRIQCPPIGGHALSGAGRRVALGTVDGMIAVDLAAARSGGARVVERLDGVLPERFCWLPDDGYVALCDDGSLRRVTASGGELWRVDGVGPLRGATTQAPLPALALVPSDADGATEEIVEVAIGTPDGKLRTFHAEDGRPAATIQVAANDRSVYLACFARLEDGTAGFATVAGRIEDDADRGRHLHSVVDWTSVDGPSSDPQRLAERADRLTLLDVDASGWWLVWDGRPTSRWVGFGRVDGTRPDTVVPELPAWIQRWNRTGTVRAVDLEDGHLAISASNTVQVFDLREIDAQAAAAEERLADTRAQTAPPEAAPKSAPGETAGPPVVVPYRETRLTHLGAVATLSLEPGARTLLTGTSDGFVRRWAVNAEIALEPILQVPGTQLLSVASFGDDRILAIDGENRLHVSEPPAPPFARIRFRYGFAQVQPVFDDGQILAVMPGGLRFARFDPKTPAERSITHTRAWKRSVAFQSIGCYGGADEPDTLFGVARGDPPQIYAFDVASQAVRGPMSLPPDLLFFARQSRDGERFGTLHIPAEPGAIERSSLGVRRRHADGSWGDLTTIDFGPEHDSEPAARFALTGAGERIVLAGRRGGVWQNEGGKNSPIRWRHPGSLPATACCDLPDGRVVVGFSDGELHIIDARTGDSRPLPGFDAACSYVTASRDGRSIAAGDATGRALLVDLTDAAPTVHWRAHGRRIVFASFSADGDQLATSSRDGTVAVWPTRPARIREAVERARPIELQLAEPMHDR